MNHLLLYHLFQYAFFLLAPVLLLIKWNKPQVPWWLIIAIALFAGWALLLGKVVFYYDALYDEITWYQTQGLQAPVQLLDTWAADGAKKAFALIFGWFFALIYLLPWLIVYGLLARYRKNQKCHEKTKK